MLSCFQLLHQVFDSERGLVNDGAEDAVADGTEERPTGGQTGEEAPDDRMRMGVVSTRPNVKTSCVSQLGPLKCRRNDRFILHKQVWSQMQRSPLESACAYW